MARNHLHNIKQGALLLRFDLEVYVCEPSGSYTRITGARPPRKSFLFLPQVLDTSVGQRSAAVVGDRRRLVRWLTPPSPPQGVVYRTAPGSPGCYLSLVMVTGGDDPVLYAKWSSAESMARRVPEQADVFGHLVFLYGVMVPLAVGDGRLLNALQDVERFIYDQFVVASLRESVVVGGADPQEVARFRIAQAGRAHLIYQQAAVFAAQWITLHPQTGS